MTETISFNLERKTRPVELAGPTGIKKFTLVELSGKDRDSYLNTMAENMQYDKGQSPRMKNFEGLQAKLVHLHLHDEAGVRVSIEDIQLFPAKVVTKLFEACQELSDLGEEDEEEVGNA